MPPAFTGGAAAMGAPGCGAFWYVRVRSAQVADDSATEVEVVVALLAETRSSALTTVPLSCPTEKRR